MTLAKLTVVVAGGGTADLVVDDVGSVLPALVGRGVPVQRLAPLAAIIVTPNQTLTVSTSVVTLTVPTGATHALASIEGADVRAWEDGTNPTATSGLLLVAGTVVEFDNLATLKLIRAGATDATVNLSYRRYV